MADLDPGVVEPEREFTRREWLTRAAIMGGASATMAREAVASVALEHDDWDMDGETKTLAEWEMLERSE